MGLKGKVAGGFRGNLRKASRLGFEGGLQGGLLGVSRGDLWFQRLSF